MKDIKNITIEPKVYISGAGVFHVRSSEVIRSKQGQRQLNALSRLKTLKKEKHLSDKDKSIFSNEEIAKVAEYILNISTAFQKHPLIILNNITSWFSDKDQMKLYRGLVIAELKRRQSEFPHVID